MLADNAGHGGLVQRLSAGPTQVALWLIVVLLAVHAAILLIQPGQRAIAQPAAAAARDDSSGVFVVPCQLEKDLWGVCLIDTRVGSIVLYQYSPNSHKIKLMAARSYLFDVRLKEYNVDGLTPAQVEEIISKTKPAPAEK